MKLTDRIIKAISTSETYKSIMDYCVNSNCDFSMVGIKSASVEQEKNGTAVFLNVDCNYVLDGELTQTVEQFKFKVGLATPKGYFSAKKVPVLISDYNNVFPDELTILMGYWNESTKENTFDPFFYENNILRNNAAGWVSVASKLQADCR
jgi:hypothetical protein